MSAVISSRLAYHWAGPVLKARSGITHRRGLSTVNQWATDVVGHKTVHHDIITASPLRQLAASIDTASTAAVQAPDAVVPPNWHLVYFANNTPETELSSDGYESTHAPPEPFVNRVWAGGELEWQPTNPLRVGQGATLDVECAQVDTKQSPQRGPIIFVNLHRTTRNDQGISLVEKRSLAYMHPPSDGVANKASGNQRIIPIKKAADFSQLIHPTEIMLFRFSALTFNSHRIHYDYPYATQLEGHRGLLVHGPLTCTLLLNLARHQTRSHPDLSQQSAWPFRRFTYRAVSPLICGEPFTVNGRWTTANDGTPKACELWAANSQGGLAMSGTLELV
ncbi:hypothetical protein H4R34_003497 [Dimargaris verticillata]|uniref:HotDog domain-containing protein n=1 Tax=Dimargaris verticillata TaxID=2761393 RepID=A0A9W8AZX2_9FUNG|nr:hypothetical protein H4R34_003497 [Dimargaris verticillata]